MVCNAKLYFPPLVSLGILGACRLIIKVCYICGLQANGSNKGGPFERKLTALYTPATLEAGEDLDGDLKVSLTCMFAAFIYSA